MQSIFMEDAPGAALLVLKENKIIIEKGYGCASLATKDRVSSFTNFRMASVSKQFTAMSILLLAEKQKLYLDTPLKLFFSGLPITLQEITVEQLLNHTSGIVDYEALISLNQTRQVLDEDVLKLIMQKGSVYYSAGKEFKYSNTGYCLLAMIVQQVTKITFADFVRENIFHPLQMNHSLVYDDEANIPNRAYGYHPVGNEYYFADQDNTSATLGDGGIYTSLNDYRKWIESLESNKLLAKKWTDKLSIKDTLVKNNIGYSYGWFTGKEKDGTSCRFHSGESTGFRNMVYHNPEKHLLIVLFSNRDDDAVKKVFDAVSRLLNVQIDFSGKNNLSPVQWLGDVYESK